MLDKLLGYMEERGTPILQCPTISKNPLDLFRLYVLCRERGGFTEVRGHTCQMKYACYVCFYDKSGPFDFSSLFLNL